MRIAVTRRIFALPVGSGLRRLAIDHTTRLGFHEFNRGDLTLSVAFHSRDAEIKTPLAGLDMEALRGKAGAARTWQTWAEMWGESRRELEEIVDAGDRLLFVVTHVARGRDGLEMRQPLGLLLEFRDGEVVRHTEFFDLAEALRQVGA